MTPRNIRYPLRLPVEVAEVLRGSKLSMRLACMTDNISSSGMLISFPPHSSTRFVCGATVDLRLSWPARLGQAQLYLHAIGTVIRTREASGHSDDKMAVRLVRHEFRTAGKVMRAGAALEYAI